MFFLLALIIIIDTRTAARRSDADSTRHPELLTSNWATH